MADSLQDQLKALGLAKAKKPTEQKPRRKPHQTPKPKPRSDAEMSLDQAYRLRIKEEKQSAHNKKELKRLEDLKRRRINNQVQELVKDRALNDKSAEVKRNFVYKGRIRSVLVTPEQLRQLNSGELGLVFVRGNYYIMLPEHVAQAHAISPDHIPDLLPAEPDNPDEEGEFKVPDDLIW
ncbi:MAG: hypothetical protein ACI9H8_000361 [Lysobacterales bacterium]|jgi:uncharacterized protein YaiL (DUF2058 family)